MRHTRNDRTIVIDLEMTCWENGNTPLDQFNEIIEIGLVEVDNLSMEIVREKNFYVKPLFCDVSPYCTELTGITPKRLKGAPDLKSTLARIGKEFGTLNKTWMAWGKDNIIMEENCKRHLVTNPFSDSFINLSNMFTLFMGENKRMNLYKVMDTYNVPYSGNIHSGLDDARNAAKLYCFLMRHMRNLPKPEIELSYIQTLKS